MFANVRTWEAGAEGSSWPPEQIEILSQNETKQKANSYRTWKKQKRREWRHIPTKNANKTKENSKGIEFHLDLKTAMSKVTFLLRIISNFPTKRHKSNEWIKNSRTKHCLFSRLTFKSKDRQKLKTKEKQYPENDG